MDAVFKFSVVSDLFQFQKAALLKYSRILKTFSRNLLTEWQGGTKYFARKGSGNPRHAACVFLGETLTSSPRDRS